MSVDNDDNHPWLFHNSQMDIEEPFDIVKGCIAQKVKVGLKSGREDSMGILHAFDQHMNMVLREVTER